MQKGQAELIAVFAVIAIAVAAVFISQGTPTGGAGMDPPTLTAVPGTNPGEIYVSWVYEGGYNLYYIMQYKTTGDWIDLTGPSDNRKSNYLHSVPTDTLYYYRVTSCSSSGCTYWSTIKSSYPKIGISINVPSTGNINENIQLNSTPQYISNPVYNWSMPENTAGCSFLNNNTTIQNPIINCTQGGTGKYAQIKLTIKRTANNDTAFELKEINISDPSSVPEEPVISSVQPGANPGQITVNWDTVTGTYDYRVRWYSGAYNNNPGQTATGTSFTYTTTVPADYSSQLHSHEVAACNSSGQCGGWSAPATGYPKIGVGINGNGTGIIGEQIALQGTTQYAGSSPQYIWSSNDPAHCSFNPIAQNTNFSCSTTGPKTVYLTVTANGQSVSSQKTIEINSNLPPGIPTNLTVQPGTNTGENKVNWDASSGATKYEIYRSEDGSYTKINETTSIPFIDIHSDGTAIKYFYKVKACNTADCSNFSAENGSYPKIGVTINSPASGATDTPITITATPIYVTSPGYTWSVSGAGCTSTTGGSSTYTINCSSTGTATVNLSISGNSGDSAIANPVNISIINNKPNIPTGVDADLGDNGGEIEITWNTVTDAANYNVQTPDGLIQNIAGTSYTYTAPSNPTAISHCFKVAACNANGCSALSAQDCSVPKVKINANGPYNKIKNTNFTLNETIEHNPAGSTKSWNITNNLANCTPPTGSGIASSANITLNCSNAETALITLTVTSTSGTDSDDADISITSSGVPSAPTDFRAETGDKYGAVKLYWSTVWGAAKYKIEWRAGTYNGVLEYASAGTQEPNVTIPPEVGLMHYYKIRSCNSAGECGTSSTPEVSAYPHIDAYGGEPYLNKTTGVAFQLNGQAKWPVGTVSYQWVISDYKTPPNTENADCNPKNPTGPNPTITCTKSDFVNTAYAFANLTVTANNGTATAPKVLLNIKDSPPPTPTNFKAESHLTDPGYVKLSWTAVTDADSYIIEWTDGKNITLADPAEITTNINPHNHKNSFNTTTKERLEQTYRIKAVKNGVQSEQWSAYSSAYPKIGAEADDKAGTPGSPIQLNGIAKYADGTIDYDWGITLNSAGCSLSATDISNPTITCTTTGTRTLKLTVTANGDTATDNATITISAEADTTDPIVSITSPSNGATVDETVTVTVTANDNVGIQSVLLKVDGVELETISATPYTFQWDTTAEDNGSHTLQAIAKDTSDNEGESTIITVTVNNIEFTCGDTTCNTPEENSANCPDDCGVIQDCGNTTCDEPEENYQNCPADCPTECGNTICETPTENNSNCPADCPLPASCGNGNLETGEDCEIDSDCNTRFPKTTCDYTNQKYGTRTVTCSSCNCTTGNWNYTTTNYCNNCSHCGDGKQNCEETETSCPRDFGGEDDTTPPAKPNGLSLIRTTENSITIEWNPNSETDLGRYIIYYGKNSGNYLNETTALKTETNITLTALEKTVKYYIAIKAIDQSGNKSEYSDEISATTKGNGIVIEAPTEFKATQEGENVKLTWNYNEPKADSYIIEKKTEDFFEELATTSDNKFTDEKVEPEKTYTYRITAIKDGEQSDYSKEVEITVKKETPKEDNFLQWGIAATIIAVSAALTYVFFTFDI